MHFLGFSEDLGFTVFTVPTASKQGLRPCTPAPAVVDMALPPHAPLSTIPCPAVYHAASSR